MGDHRPKITCHFEMHGHVADYDFGWCNWSPNSDGIDQRIADWFREQSEIAISKWRAGIEEDERERNKAAQEAAERAELARLKAKYESR
jgi:hypothetical protein